MSLNSFHTTLHDMIIKMFIGLFAICLTSSVSFAQHWFIQDGESISLFYGTERRSNLSIDCAASESQITVAPSPVKPPVQPAVLKVETRRGIESYSLETELDPNGYVSTYFVRRNGRQMALHLATTANRLLINAPGAHISAAADKAVFRRYAALCRKHS
jgi:hypothetical protein